VKSKHQFGAAMRLDYNDTHVALEYAFLCYETKKQAEARHIFDRIRKIGHPAFAASAEQAFQNIDTPLRIDLGNFRSPRMNWPILPSSATNSTWPPSTTWRLDACFPTVNLFCPISAASSKRR